MSDALSKLQAAGYCVTESVHGPGYYDLTFVERGRTIAVLISDEEAQILLSGAFDQSLSAVQASAAFRGVDLVPTAVIIPSGWEWECPVCHTVNNQIEVTDESICVGCATEVELAEL